MLFRRTTCIFMTLLLLFSVSALSFASSSAPRIYSDGDSGEAVLRIQIRLRELGYLSYPPTGVYRAMTVEAVKAFQTRCGSYGTPLAVDGRIGSETMKQLFSQNAPRVAIPDSVHMPRGPIASALVVTGKLVDWSEVESKLTVGSVYTLTDCNTGESFRLVFTGGANHAEMELFSSDEKPVFDAVCGGEYNFLKRPVVVKIGGVDVAASMQCAPHGLDTVADNGIDGHVCVFFSGSLSHVGALADVEHETIVRQAAKQ
ncbi:MAG: peptidoglycan-binding protein [Clostridia bacterium]|nr:peptidoglycan-binding protein [Clostridia bacterium]